MLREGILAMSDPTGPLKATLVPQKNVLYSIELFELTLRFRFEMEKCVYLMVSGLRARMSGLM